MSTLLVSKINSIEVIQVGESKLTTENKFQDAGTIGVATEEKSQSFNNIGFGQKTSTTAPPSSGGNKTIDLGKGAKTLAIRVFVTNREDNDALFDALYEKRFCEITDKFKGQVSVYIRKVTVIDSDKHVDRTIFDIEARIEDVEKPSGINFSSKVDSLTGDIENATVPGKANKIRDLVLGGTGYEGIVAESILKQVAKKAGVYKFGNASIEKLNAGLNWFLKTEGDATGALGEATGVAKGVIKSPAGIKNAITNLADFPERLSSLAVGLAGDATRNPFASKSSGKKFRYRAVVKMPISVPTVRGESANKFDSNKLSQIEKKNLALDTEISNLINETKLLSDIKAIQAGGFTTRASFDETVNQIILRLHSVGYSEGAISERIFIIKSFAHTQDYPDTVVINISIPQPLVRIVYDRYGNLDNYDRIEALNGLKDNDHIAGNVVVFE